MNDKAGRFVDHDEVFVLKDDRDGDILALGLGVLRLRQSEGQGIAFIDPVFRLNYFRAADGDVPGLDQGLDPVAAKGFQMSRQHRIQPFPGIGCINC